MKIKPKKDEKVFIKVSRETREELKKHGEFGETFEDVIKKLMQFKEHSEVVMALNKKFKEEE